MGLDVEEYGGHGVLLQELVVALSLEAVWSKVLRTDAAVLGGLEVLPFNRCLPLLTETGTGERELVEGDGLVLVVAVLAAVSGAGLHHPSGPPASPSAREAGEGAVGVAALRFDPLAALGGLGQQLRGRGPHRGGVCGGTALSVAVFALAERPQLSLVSHLQDGGGSFSLTSREDSARSL